MKGGQKGQVLIFLVILLPAFILLSGVIVRSGVTLLVHNKLQSHCDKKALDAAAAQVHGLEILGQINPVSRNIIDLRRQIDRILLAALVSPPLIPVLHRARATLISLQKKIAVKQQWVERLSLEKSLAILSRKAPSEFAGKIFETFQPTGIFGPHRSQKSLLLHVQKEDNYEDEDGAPLQLDDDFTERQNVQGSIRMETEKFLRPWMGFSRSPTMDMQCEASVEMNSLEESWEVILKPPKGKSLLKQRWL